MSPPMRLRNWMSPPMRLWFSCDPPGVYDALDAVVVGEQRHGRQLHLHADLEIFGQRAVDDLAQNDQPLVGELDRGNGERLEGIRRWIRGRGRVPVLRVA